jgi:hypothetical protein
MLRRVLPLGVDKLTVTRTNNRQYYWLLAPCEKSVIGSHPESKEFSVDAFSESSAFRQLLNQVIREHYGLDGELMARAKYQQNGWLHVIGTHSVECGRV